MVTLFITVSALAIVFILGIGFFFWRRSAPETSDNMLPPVIDARSLFADPAADAAAEQERLQAAAGEHTRELISRAQNGEREALADATQTPNAETYDRVLTTLVSSADTDAKLTALMSYITRNEFSVNVALAKAVIASWQKSPDRHSTSKALHFVALSDDATLYEETVEIALELWRRGKLENVSPVELKALFEGEFWILSARTRSSGAGFVLKRTLDKARNELEKVSEARA
jgi:hypothetical protein